MKPKRATKKPAAVEKPANLLVLFQYQDGQASEVCLAGSFNDWHPSATPMVHLGGGKWAKELALDKGVHEYLFVADGRWFPDPGAAVTVPNPFGGINCCVMVS